MEWLGLMDGSLAAHLLDGHMYCKEGNQGYKTDFHQL